MALVDAEGEELVPLEPEPETPPPGDDEDDLDEALPEQPHEVDQVRSPSHVLALTNTT